MTHRSNLATHENFPRISVVRTDQLFAPENTPNRGLAHIGFCNLPPQAPGRLDFEPLLLCAVDSLSPGKAMAMHEHENVDDILLLRRGTVRHRDSLGNEGLLQAGDAYVLAAGQSVRHAESVEGDHEAHAVVIWIRPELRGGPSHFHHQPAAQAFRRGDWCLVASGKPHAAGRVLPLRRDADLLSAEIAAGGAIQHRLEPGRRAYLAVLAGTVLVNGTRAQTGERAFIEGAGLLEFSATASAEIVLIDLAVP